MVSSIGGWMQAVGAAWLMTSLSPSPLMVTMVQAASSLPMVFLAMPAGALADIANRRTLLLASQFWMLASAATLTSFVFAGALSPALLLALTFSLAVGTALMGPAFQSVITEVVPASESSAAVSLNSAGFNLARAVGPALGGVILAKTSAGFTFLLNTFSFLLVIVVLLRWHRQQRKSVLPAERFFGAIRAGLRYVRYAADLHVVLLRTGCFVILGSALWALLPLVVRNQLHLGPSAYGMMLGALGTGALAGAMLLPTLRRKVPLEILLDCNITLFGAVTVGTAVLRNFALLLVVLLCGGVAWITVLSLLNVAARRVVPAWIEARSLATYLLFFQGGTAVGSLIWGAVTARIGLQSSLICAGAGLFLNTLLVRGWSLSSVSNVDVTPAATWPQPPTLDPGSSETAPALVTIQYQVDAARSKEFTARMHELEVVRRRDGAIYWDLFVDPLRRGFYMEQFLVESWLEHLRQHERVTADDDHLQETIRLMQAGPDLPKVTHYVAHE